MIGAAIQRGDYVYVYNERNSMIYSQYGSLYGFTGSSVSIKRGDYVYVYNERGSLTASHYCR